MSLPRQWCHGCKTERPFDRGECIFCSTSSACTASTLVAALGPFSLWRESPARRPRRWRDLRLRCDGFGP